MLRSNIGVSLGLALLCAPLTGCLHQQKAPPLAPQAKTPNIYVAPPEEANLPPMQSQPALGMPASKPVVAEEAKPKRKTKRPTVTPSAPTVAVVTPSSPPETAPSEAAKLGALGSGGDANPRQQQDVADRISSVEKRLTDFPPATQDREQKQIAKVRLFTKEASDALKAGDVDGARILATKAELLLDDLIK